MRIIQNTHTVSASMGANADIRNDTDIRGVDSVIWSSLVMSMKRWNVLVTLLHVKKDQKEPNDY